MSTIDVPADTVSALARAFAVGLRRLLSLKTLADIDAANAGGEDRCASIEWVDAYDVMDCAFTAVMRRGFSTESEADLALWSAAWRHARETGFAVLARKAKAG